MANVHSPYNISCEAQLKHKFTICIYAAQTLETPQTTPNHFKTTPNLILNTSKLPETHLACLKTGLDGPLNVQIRFTLAFSRQTPFAMCIPILAPYEPIYIYACNLCMLDVSGTFLGKLIWVINMVRVCF